MSMHCIVQDCRLHGDSAFFQLPKDESVREKWVENLKLSTWFLTTKKAYRVCFRHFPKEAFKTSGKHHVTLKKGIYFYISYDAACVIE